MKSPGNSNITPFNEHFEYSRGGITHTVFTAGSGPGVVLMHELPGMTKEFWRLANWLAEHFTVWAPDLFGNSSTPTKPVIAKLVIKACISREIHLFSNDDPGPITQWLRSLSKDLHDKIKGPGVGVIGMCMTGNFALTLALDPWVTAPITSQPGIPASTPFTNRDGGLQMTDVERGALAARDIDVMALRFAGDRLCKAARFETIRQVVGDNRIHAHVIDDEHRNPNGPLKHPHSVLTADLVNDDNGVTKQKLMQVIEFLKQRIE
jgi:dienelactone hydrolase